MQSRMLQRLALAAILVLVAGVSVVSTAAARPSRPSPSAKRGGFSLFGGGAIGLVLNANRINCNWITNFGQQCTNPYGSGTVEAGFWPNGTGDSYVFGGGLELGGTVLYDSTAGQGSTGPWVGDTVGVFFEDPYGSQKMGDPIDNIYNGANVNDIAAWPSGAYIKDPNLYASALLGLKTISQQDTWQRYWDGNTALTTGRKHSMGVLVEQRGLLWNYPSGNQDILYFLFRFINITSTRASDYAALAAAGYTADDIQNVVSIATDFHSRAQAAYGVTLPATGYTFHNFFVSYTQDPDVGVTASDNFSTAVFPFSLVAAMKANYSEPTWTYPATVFGEPFYPTVGYEAIKYLKSPIDSTSADIGTSKYGREFGISVWGNTTNSNQFGDPRGVSQLYRYISGHPSSAFGDGNCNSDPIKLHTCYAAQGFDDTRMFVSSGPYELRPGQSSVVVVAMIFAAPVHTWAATTNGKYAMTAGNINAYINPGSSQTYSPGWPAQPESLAVNGAIECYGTPACTGAATIRDAIERPMGWGQFSDANGDGRIDQTEVQTVSGSLLGKALVAQAVFDNKFLLPFAPESPDFYLVPGDGKVTIAWKKSPTETVHAGGGDPYFAVASARFTADGVTPNPLYDPNYRQYDVEGYRIWRGRTAAEMQVVAQFDYAGTSMIDYSGTLYDPNVYGNQCAPELGVQASCPTLPHTFPLAGDVIQIPPGGRVPLANGNILIVSADTAVTGGGSGYPALTDQGVPFAYVDQGLLNGVQYFYAVTAFDINSLKSGPSSLQSSLVTKYITPRAPASNAQSPVLVVGMFGDDTTALDPTKSTLTLDPATGEFSGLVPPTNGGALGFGAYVAEALPPGDITARIDSVSAGYVPSITTALPPYLYMSFISGTDTVRAAVNVAAPPHNSVATVLAPFASPAVPLVKYDTVRAKALGIPASFASSSRISVQFTGNAVALTATDLGATMINGRLGVPGTAAATVNQYLGHAVWYNEGSSEPPQPTINPFGSQAHTNGLLTGVDLIYEPIPYRLPVAGGAAADAMNAAVRYVIYGMAAAYYPADFVVTWNADSTLTVRDSTHHVFSPFRTDLGPGWGFVNERAYTAANNNTVSPDPWVSRTVVGYHHMYALHPACDIYIGMPCTVLQKKAEYEQIDYQNQGTAGGSGVMLYIDGMFFIMKMSALPAAGTKWHLKAVGGYITATCPTLPTDPTTVPTACSNWSYAPPAVRPAYVPGLQFKLRVLQGFGIARAAGDLSRVHTVPDPYYVTNALETSSNDKVLEFVNLPNQAIIRIYSVSGILIRVLTHNDPTGGGLAVWDLRNRNNQFVASGVYFYHVEAPDGSTKIGRFTVVNYAQ